MADHDLGAELAGYRAELAQYEAAGKDERADAVRGEIDRVERAVREEAERLERQADEQEGNGQDVPAAEARVRAREFRALLDDGEKRAEKPARRGPGRPRKETAEDKTPREKA